MGKVRFNTWELQEICYKNKWFTGGSCESYEKLFDRCREGADFDELAMIIWVCTPDKDRREIYYQLLVEKAEMRLQEFKAVIDDFDYIAPTTEELELLTETRKSLERIANA